MLSAFKNADLRLEEFYSHTEKIQQKRTRKDKTKQRKTMYSEQLYTITWSVKTIRVNHFEFVSQQ